MSTRIALVTGAGSGIGREVSLALHAAGYSVVLAGRRAAELEHTAEMAAGAGGGMLAVPADVGKPEEVRQLFGRTKEVFGRLDVLFNNAGIGAPAIPMEELTYEQWSAVLAVNLTGSFLCAQEAMRLMKSQKPRGGRIINNGSISAHVPRPNSAPYTTDRMAGGVPQANGTTMAEPRMDVRHVAEAVVFMAGLPLDANVQFMTVMATTMPFIGRG